MKLVADDIETMRVVLRAYWTNSGHSAEAPEALCDLALKGLSAVAEGGASGWILASDQLPDEAIDKEHKGDTISKWLLVYSPGYIPEIAHYHWPTDSWETPDKEWPELPITHWMRLPDGPAEKA